MPDDPNAGRRRSRQPASDPTQLDLDAVDASAAGSADQPLGDEPLADETAPVGGTASPEPDEPDAPATGEHDAGPEPATAEPDDGATDGDNPQREPEPETETEAAEPGRAAADPAIPTPASATRELDDWTEEDVLAEGDGETPTTLWSSPVPEPATWLPWLQARSPDERICPFLRAVADDDGLGFPLESPDAANRCAAMREAVPQSLRQQELVCLTPTHVNCPRYLRGAAVASEAVAPTVKPKALLTPAISAALVILALSFGASVVFGLANGGLAMPSKAAATRPVASASAVAAASPASTRPAPSVATSIAPAVSASPVPSSAAPSASAVAPSAAPSASASPAPASTPAPSVGSGATPGPSLTPARAKLLTPCPDKPNCWIYRIRSGDNLYSIAKYFGVPLSRVKTLNPWTKTTRLKAGQKLILPNPTR